jgi:hypothetical protein
MGVTIGAHDDEIGAEGQCLRQQKVPHAMSSGRQTPYLHLRAVTCQVACDVRPRLLPVTRSVALMVNDQDLDRVGPHK